MNTKKEYPSITEKEYSNLCKYHEEFKAYLSIHQRDKLCKILFVLFVKNDDKDKTLKDIKQEVTSKINPKTDKIEIRSIPNLS